MIRINSPFGRFTAVASLFVLNFALIPTTVLADSGKSVRDYMKRKADENPPVRPSKVLSSKRMKLLQGKAGENPYASGQSKWDVVYKGVNLMTGNFTASGTDLTFEGGYGIPVNVTRSYSSNDADEGPLGKGWTLSVDVRSTAGGLMKSAAAPTRAVPVNFKERPTAQVDPNAVTADGSLVQPIQAVMATDAGGTEETIQRDADGILSTPPWDKNKMAPEYETIINSDGSNTQILTKNYVNTPEGTVYLYEKQGTYTGGGVKPYDNPSATAEPSNILKISTATDRHGNATNYTYSTSTWVYFTKSNGTTQERPLTSISMPNGHTITFTWTDVDPGSGVVSRITRASDGVRNADYGYSNDGLLTSFTTPGGKQTTYGYGSATAASGYPTVYSSGLLNSITSPQGLTTNIYYKMAVAYIGPYASNIGLTPQVLNIKEPSGNFTTFKYDYYTNTGIVGIRGFAEDYVAAHWSGVGDYFIDDTTAGGQEAYMINAVKATIGYHTALPGITSTEGGMRATLNSTYDRMKTFDPVTQDLLIDDVRTFHAESQVMGPVMDPWNLAKSRKLVALPGVTNGPISKNITTTAYNFMGKPLTTTVDEYTANFTSNTSSNTRSATTAYAYWGADKYYQQKAVKDPAGRYSYTDYYDSSAATGKKGQTYKVYDEKRTTFVEDSSSVPSGTPSGNYWKYRLIPQTDTYSAKFDYDSKGRPIDVWKLQSTTTTPSWTYVRTNTTYGSDSSPQWGAATQVIEDYGGIGRTTQTTEYDSIGRAIKVQDASGKIFKTNYDLDGVISSIQRLDSGTTDVVTYTYGTSGVTSGQVLNVTDNLSGVSQDITYFTSGASVGQIASVTETNGTDVYSSSYTYNAAGERETSTYVTQSALGQSDTVRWKYSDYVPISAGSEVGRACQTLTRLDGSGNPTSEEFHYVYTSRGKLTEASYAMTPQSWTPSSGASFYDSSHMAATRARAHYNYDGGARMTGTYNWWDTYSSGSYSSQFIRGNESVYELTGSKRGLKTHSKYLVPVSGSPTTWSVQRDETFSYDSDTDYLAGADYDDGLANETITWDYDAAGNRASDSSNSGTWTYDNLNRMTASPGVTYTNDILGNRTAKGSTSYSWDILNRMTGLGSYSYVYRADGMRVSKSSSTGSASYRYDGQMGTEDVERNSGGTVITLIRNGIGQRGIDVISKTTSSGNTLMYPVYDVNGNCVGQLSRNSSSFTVSDERSYDAWGDIRSGGTSNNKARFGANIGHKQDDESGLIYMRARYYEPTSGRFISQDAAHDGFNWYIYAKNCPYNFIDSTGKSAVGLFALGYALAFVSVTLSILSVAYLMGNPLLPAAIALAVLSTLTCIGSAMAFAGGFMALENIAALDSTLTKAGTAVGMTVLVGMLKMILDPVEKAIKAMGIAARGAGGIAMTAFYVSAAYSLAVTGCLIAIAIEEILL